ncbi:MAG: FkbM family methyltransferase [Chlamydiales bacterium]|jgi:FkbM family methyltransferase
MTEESDTYSPLVEKTDALNLSHFFENIINGIYNQVLEENCICIDGGANHGLHTLPMAKLVGPGGKVLAFEPVEESAEFLRDKLCSHDLDDHVEVYQYALSNVDDMKDFIIIADDSGYSGLHDRGDLPNSRRIVRSIITTKIDSVMASLDYKRLDFIKLDLEGGEFDALQGAYKSIQNFRPIIVFESGKEMSAKLYKYTKTQFFKFMKKIDYAVFDILGDVFTLNKWKQLTPWYFVAIPKETLSLNKELAHSIHLKTLLKQSSKPRAFPAKKQRQAYPRKIKLVKKGGKSVKEYSIKDFYKLTGIHYIYQMEFENEQIAKRIYKQCSKALKNDQITIECQWLGVLYSQDLLEHSIVDVSVRWINKEVGYGLFAEKDIKAKEFIGEYAGLVRKDEPDNLYSFTYPTSDFKGYWKHNIDAEFWSNEIRYANHSDNPNAESAALFHAGLLKIIIRALKDIDAGSQITYDYSQSYWEALEKTPDPSI